MKRIHLLVVKSYVGPLILTFFIVIFILLMQFLWKYIDDLVGKGLEIGVIAELITYTSASFVPLSLPLAILISSLMTFGNMGENNELLALKSSGISLQRIMFPLIVLTFVLSIAAFFFANNVLPVIHLHARALLNDIRQSRPELSIKTGVFYNGIDGYSIKIDSKNTETKLLKGIRIYNHTQKDGNSYVTVADSGYIRMAEDESKLLVTLYQGKSYVELEEPNRRIEEKTFPHHKEYFKEQNLVIHLKDFGLTRRDEALYASGYQMMTIQQLSHAQDSIKKQIKVQQKRVYSNLQKNLVREIKYVQDEGSRPSYDTLNISPYAIYASLNGEQKKRAYEKAISDSRVNSHVARNFGMSYDNTKNILKRHQIEWHYKITLAFACLVFFFIGAPLGAIIRKGGLGTPIVVSVAFFLIYYMLSLTGKKLVREGLVEAFTGMWSASVILFVIGVFLTYKATTDSVILNTDTYLNFIKNIFKNKKRSKNENIATMQ